jgi:hypothetical protein
MQIAKLIQNHTYSGLVFVVLFAMIAVFVNSPESNLEQRVTDLENRVDSLEEAVLGNRTSEEADELEVSSDKASSIANWRQLETGMSYDDVRELLGEPHKINGGNIAFWRYQNGGFLQFISGELSSWNEP